MSSIKTGTAGRWVIGGLVAAGVALTIGLSFWRASTTIDATPPAKAADSSGTVAFRMEQQWLIKLKLAQAEEATVARQVTTTGRVVPAARNRAIVASPVSGIIAGGALPRVGQEVTPGQILAVLQQTPSAAESAQMRVENVRLEADRRRLTESRNESQVRLNLAKTEYERAQRLYERKAYSQRQVQIAEADYKAAAANLAAITEQLAALSDPTPAAAYEVKAPIAGTVVKVDKAMGEHLDAGEPVLEIVNLDTVWIEAPIFEGDLARLRKQIRATFATPAFSGREFHGSLIDAGSVIDEKSRAATAVFEAPNPSRLLRIGMQANLRLDADETVKAVMIPKEAVLENEGKKIVYVLISGETFQRREVVLGDEYGGKVAVLSGLQPGQRVVTQGAYQLKLQELRPADAGAHMHET